MGGKEGGVTNAPALRAEGVAYPSSVGAFVLQRYSIIYPMAFLLTAAVMILLTFDLAAVERLSQENQLIENVTVVLYGLAILWLALGGNGDRHFRYQSAFLLAVMAARELSFQKAFTTESMTRMSYWIRSEAPLSEKLVAGAVALSVIYLVLRYFSSHHRRLWQGLREGRCHAVSIMVAVMLVPISKTLDSASRILRDKFGMPVPDDIGTIMGLFEEMLELGIPLAVLWALWQVARSRRSPLF